MLIISSYVVLKLVRFLGTLCSVKTVVDRHRLAAYHNKQC